MVKCENHSLTIKNKIRKWAITTSTQHKTGGPCLCNKVGKNKEMKGVRIEKKDKKSAF